MQLIRKYKKLDWFDFLTVIEQELEKKPLKEVYIDLIDEIILRKTESISEGATFKMKAPAQKILSLFQSRRDQDSSFASDQDSELIKQLVSKI